MARTPPTFLSWGKFCSSLSSSISLTMCSLGMQSQPSDTAQHTPHPAGSPGEHCKLPQHLNHHILPGRRGLAQISQESDAKEAEHLWQWSHCAQAWVLHGNILKSAPHCTGKGLSTCSHRMKSCPCSQRTHAHTFVLTEFQRLLRS